MTNGEKFIQVFGDTNVIYDPYNDVTTIYVPGDWWDDKYAREEESEVTQDADNN